MRAAPDNRQCAEIRVAVTKAKPLNIVHTVDLIVHCVVSVINLPQNLELVVCADRRSRGQSWSGKVRRVDSSDFFTTPTWK